MKYHLGWINVLAFIILIFSSILSYRFLHLDKHKILLKPKIIDMPIAYPIERKVLTAIYRQEHTGDCDFEKDGLERCIHIVPKLIVLHMTAIDSFKASFDKLNKIYLDDTRQNLLERSRGDNLNVSAHFLIDKDGTIYQLLQETYEARHAIGVNHLAIGIENVGFFPTKKQVGSNVKLIRYLMDKYKTIVGVLAHQEVSVLKDSKSTLFVERQKGYFKVKHCGMELIRLVREKMHIDKIFLR